MQPTQSPKSRDKSAIHQGCLLPWFQLILILGIEGGTERHLLFEKSKFGISHKNQPAPMNVECRSYILHRLIHDPVIIWVELSSASLRFLYQEFDIPYSWSDHMTNSFIIGRFVLFVYWGRSKWGIYEKIMSLSFYNLLYSQQEFKRKSYQKQDQGF